jgi:hypothetical protein
MVIDNYNFSGEISGFGTIKMLVMSRSVNMNGSPNNFFIITIHEGSVVDNHMKNQDYRLLSIYYLALPKFPMPDLCWKIFLLHICTNKKH